MSATPLEDIEERIERSLYEALREELVDKGYCPDISLPAYPETPAGQLQWETDLKAIKDGPLGFAIELFSTAGYQDRNTKKIPRIVINVQDFFPGALGGDQTNYYTKGTTDYTKEKRPPQSVNYYVNVHLLANTIKQLRILHALMALSLPRRGYIKFYTELEPTFAGNIFIQNITSIEHPQTEEGILEKIYRFEIQDVYETNPLDLGTVAQISEINVDIDNDGNITSMPPIT
jgi:hypothetical protein